MGRVGPRACRWLLDVFELSEAQLVELHACLASDGAKLVDQLVRMVIRAFASALGTG